MTGVPSWKRACGRSAKVKLLRSSEIVDRFGEQAVERVGLVERAHHQRIETHLHARRRVALGAVKEFNVLKVSGLWL